MAHIHQITVRCKEGHKYHISVHNVSARAGIAESKCPTCGKRAAYGFDVMGNKIAAGQWVKKSRSKGRHKEHEVGSDSDYDD